MKFKYFIQLTVLASIWGGSFLFTRISVAEFGAIPLSAVRSAIAAMALLPILYMSNQWTVFKQNWLHILVVGLISTAIPFSFISITTQYTSAGFASILNSLTPIFSAIVAWLWLKEYLSIPAVIGIGLSFVGVLVMVMDSDTISSDFTLLPILTGLGATTLYGLTGNYSRKFLSGVPPIAISAGCQFFAALALLPFAYYAWPATPISNAAWTYALILGVICTAVAFILYFHLLEHIGVARTVIVTYMVPVFAMTWGNLFLDELITYKMLLGAAFILTGIGLTTGLLSKKFIKETVNEN
ncbi:DMT family transporter [Gammaproteobacteria bacterium]|nr:DMT family transporter [Gammaproteobacteria bacterium]